MKQPDAEARHHFSDHSPNKPSAARKVLPIAERDCWFLEEEAVTGPYRAVAIDWDDQLEPWQPAGDDNGYLHVLLLTDGRRRPSVFWAPEFLCFFSAEAAQLAFEERAEE